ncbi:MAG: HAD-IIIA family hydrolase [Fulvivirga sp.]|uniref:D-glycero-alpha-D-manno-heptose-1,7-bisphosphate 7-phosphatase n=1 Tax=Fulvivirga sp. TaxID=1931237 RepID=UPI0032EED051
MNKCVFLDRDGVLNKDFVDYVYSEDKLFILPGVEDSLKSLKNAGYLIIVITNQSGITKGIYSEEDMHKVHNIMQQKWDNAIDDFYFAPGHPSFSETLSRKPGSLMFERAIAKYNIDTKLSWMIGDKDRDLIPAKKLGLKTIQVDYSDSINADYKVKDLPDAVEVIFG